jgi:Xaa-Pro dipeptidase
MSVSIEELKRRKRVICEAMEKGGVDAIVIGGSDKWEQRGLIRYLTDYYVPIFEEYVVFPLNGPLTFFAHYSYGAKHSAHYPAIEHADFIPLQDLYADPGKRIAEYIAV